MADPLAALMSGAPKSPEPSGPGDSGDDPAEVDAARDALSAIAAKDPKALSLALQRHYEACQASDDDTEDSPDSYTEG